MNRSMQVEEMTTRTNRGNRTVTTTRTTTTSNEVFSLDDEVGEISALLDNSAAKHRISVRPARSRRSPSVPDNIKSRQEKEATIRELIETEEEFVRDLKYLINNYIRWTDEGTPECKGLAQHSQFLFGGLVDIHEFHKTVLLEGIRYYSDQPNQIGRSFTRLERDFDKHAAYIDRMEGISEFLQDHPKVNACFDNRSIELGDTGRTLIDYVRLPLQRLNDYSLLLSELIKICKQLGEPTHDLERGHELVSWIPNKSRDIKFIQSIEGFGDARAGRILRHDWFRLGVGGRDKERYCFLFKNKLLVTKVRRISPDRSVFILKETLQLPEYQLIELENSIPEGEVKEQGSFILKDRHGNNFLFQSEPTVSSGWVKDIKEFTTTFANDEPIKKRGRIIEAAESVTINGVEITEVTTPNDESRSFSIEQDSSFVNVKNTQRIVDIPIQVEGGANDSYSDESIRNEYNKRIDLYGSTKVEEIIETSTTSVAEFVHEIDIEEEAAENSTSVENLLLLQENDVQKRVGDTSNRSEIHTRQTKTVVINSEQTVDSEKEGGKVQITVESEAFERLDSERAELILEQGAKLLQKEQEIEEKLERERQEEKERQQKFEQEHQRLEKEREEKLEQERLQKLEQERVEQEQQDKLEQERLDKLEQEKRRLEQEHQEKVEKERQQKLEEERLERERQEQLEQERLEKLEQEKKRLEKERLEKLEKERQEKLEKEKQERELQEKVEQERLEKLQKERQILEDEYQAKLEKERQEKLEKERQEKLEEERVEKERQKKLEEERLEKERQQKLEEERLEKERQQKLEEERLEKERQQKLEEEKLEKERQKKLEEERLEKERQQKLEEERIEKARQQKLEEERQQKLEQERLEKLEKERQEKAEKERQEKLEQERQQKLEDERKAKLEKERQEKLEQERLEKQRKQEKLEKEEEEKRRQQEQQEQQEKAQTEPERLIKDKLQRKASIKLSRDTSHKNLIRMDSTSTVDGELKPSFSLNVKSVEVEPGENATLVVETSSSSPSIVTWLKENKSLDDRLADRVKIVSKDNVHTLTLMNCSDEDSGLYTAKCSNQYGNACSSGFINVHEFTPEERERKSLERQPNFLIKMKDADLLRDTTLCFVVKPTGDPTPALKFLKDGVELEEDERIFIGRSGDLVELTIRNVSDSDVGVYSCKIKNKYGEAETQGNLTLTDEKSMFPGLDSHLLEPGEEPEFSWYRDGVKFSPEDKFKVLFKDDEDSLALVFQHVRPEDAGLYTCVASTSSGRISCSAELTVQGAIHQLLREPEPPVITAELTDTEVSTGGSAMLELKVGGFPKPDVAWTKDGNEIQAGGKYRFLYEDDESIALIIKGVSIEDAGQYVVVARNDLGEAETSGKLLVNSPPKFKAKMQDTACMTDEPFSMSVAVEGSPLPQVKWYKDGQLIIESERIQMTQSSDGVFTITFEKITLEDGGNYSVVASNSIGQMSEFWNLVANSRARITKKIESSIEIKEKETYEYSVEIDGNPNPEVKWFVETNGVEKEVSKGLKYSYKCSSRTEETVKVKASNAFGTDECSSEVKVLRGSKIQSKLNNVTVGYNQDASFTVKVDEYPKGKVSWYIDGIEIDGKKYEKAEEGNTHTLKIHNVTETAKIKVRAENQYGYDEQEARLDVIRKPEITRPLEESYTEVEQKTLKLSVDVTANPEPEVVWFHNGQQVDADARIKIHREGTETWSLTFNVLLPSDSGDWTVKSKNEAGEAESKTVVIVEGKPVFEKKLIETVECVESDSVSFEVKVSGSPNPVIQWSLNNEELTVSKRTSIETNNETRSTTISKLVINNTLLEDSGKVTCVARNEHGSCETSTQLLVTPSGPKLKLDASPRVVEEGHPLKLTAGVTEGAKIKWLADGKEIGKGANLSFTPTKDTIVKCVATDDKGQEDSVEVPVRVMSLPKISGLKDVNCGPGETVTLSPKIESEMDGLTVFWAKLDGEKIKDCVEGDYTLKLENVQPKDVGKYIITARNAVGESTAYAKLTVLVEAPSFTRGLADLKLREGEPLSLRVRVMGLPEPTVVWEKDGEKITAEVKDGAYEFHREGIKLNEFGVYRVTAENVAGKAETSGKVVLIEEKPIVSKGPERSKTVEESEPLTLSANVTGSPIPSVQWLKDGEPINLEPGRVEVTSAPGGAQKLVIAKAEKADDGVYTLVAENPVGSVKSSPSQVSVIPIPVLPTVKITAPEEATHGEEVILKINISGEPSPKLTIFENDKPIEPLRIIKDKTNPNQVSYVLQAPRKGTSVTYSALVTNPSGQGNDEILVKLNAPPSAPVVVESLPATKSAVEGTPLKLTSVLSGNPLPKIQWLRDNVPIPCTTTEIGGKLHTAILVDGVGAGDAGVYTLVAENPSGVEKQECQVSVLGKQDDSKPLEAPSFSTTFPENIMVNEGDELVLQVGVTGNPLPKVEFGRIQSTKDKEVPLDDGSKGLPDAKTPSGGDDAGAGKPKPSQADISDSGIGKGQAVPGTVGDDGSAGAQPKVGDLDGGDADKATLDDDSSKGQDQGKAIPDGLGKGEISPGGDVLPGEGAQPDSSTGAGASPSTPLSSVGKPAEKSKAAPGSIPDADSSKSTPAVSDGPTLEPLSAVYGPGAQVDESFDGKNAILRVPGMRHGFEGPVSIKLTNPLGTTTGTVNVGVRKVYSPAKITDKFNDVHQVRGGDAKFSAKITGDPRPDVTWKFNGKVLPQDTTKYGLKWDGKTASLTVRNVGDGDLGKYTLHAENIEGSDECSGVLKELSSGSVPPPTASTAEKGEKPYFLKKIANTEVYEGVSVKFTACVGGFPEPEFHWFKDDMRIYPGGRHAIENNDSGLLRLIINKAGIEDVGVYTLKIFNKYGEDQCQANCTAEDFHVSSSAGTEPKSAVSRVPGPPNPLPDKPIISSMTDRHLCLSWKPALRTHIDYPVTYTVEMCPANTNDWFKLRSGIKGCVTEVRNLEPGMDYKFRIRVENRLGISEPSPYAQTLRSKLDWRPKPWTPPGGDYDLNRPPHPGFTHAPKFLNENKEQYGVPGCGIGVEWWLYGYPKPTVTFLYNGEPISSTDHVFDTNGRVILYIDKLSESRQGRYECIAVNEHGTDRYTINVLIGEHPKWVIRLQETHILERRDGKLSGLVTAKPKPDFKWFKDWATLAETSRIKFIVLEQEPWTYRVSLTLNDSILKDHGLYSCTASNVVGKASSSANIEIEELEEEWRYKSYNTRLAPLSLKNKSPRDFYAFGDEVGRGTQGVIRHATGLHNGVAVSIKSMESSDAGKRQWMRNEFDIHSDLFHPGITRVSDGYQDERGIHIVSDICTGGDIISSCISRGGFSEHQVADYMRQLLLSLDYLHNTKSTAHLGLNIFDIMFSHEESDTIKLIDFGLARRITSKLERLDYGHPEFTSPESLNGEGVGFSHDMWGVGIITYLLLNGTTPFLGSNDQETIENVKRGTWDFLNKSVSDSGQDFLRRLLTYDSQSRLDVRRALEHPWISKYFSNSTKKITSSQTTYRSSLQKWYENASCRTVYRRNPWSYAYSHPSRMIYPPGEIDFEMTHGSRDPKDFNYGVPNYPRPDLNIEVGAVKSESHYQNGPDTYLLQLRDADFPARLRQYMKVAASRSPSFALQLKSSAYDRNNPIIRERRRFTDVMDEEVKDERVTQGQEWRGEPRRLRHEVGLHLDTSAQADAIISLHKDGTAGFIREGPPLVVKASIGDTIEIPCIIGGTPAPTVQWFKNDLVLGPTHRISPEETCLKIKDLCEYDYGLYKLSARNSAGSHTIKFRIVQGHYTPPTPSNTDYSGIEAHKIITENTSSITYNELLTSGGQFGQWSLGKSAEDGQLVQRLSNPVEDLNIKSSLAHTGLLRLKSLINDSNHVYFVYHENSSNGYCKLVDKYIQDGVYNELDVSNAVYQILSVLSYVQWRGLQLLNVNLDNILVDTHGNVKLFDTSSIVRVTRIGSVLPIPSTITQFTAPEVLAGDLSHLTTDIWSIGCLVYALLSGVWPFAGDDDKQTRSNIQFVRYRFEPLYTNSTPEATRFLMMIFKKCPMKRPTIEEVLESRWLATQESLQRKRNAASFKSDGLEKLVNSSSFIVS